MLNQCHIGDCRALLKEMATDGVRVQMCVTSPPYFGLRDYGHDGQIGLEATPDAYVAKLVEVFREVRRVLRDDGTLWLNLGDSYVASATGNFGTKSALNGIEGESYRKRISEGHEKRRGTLGFGLAAKQLIGIPWRVAFALQADGWYLRSDIIWHKPSPMPESVTDRPTKAHEYLFLLAKSERYYYDAEAIAEAATGRAPGKVTHKGADAYNAGDEHHRTKGGLVDIGARDTRNRRSVWSVASEPFSEAHFATYPRALIEPCVLAGSRPGDVVLDPFMGSGTTAQVAEHLGRQWIGCELNPDYMPLQAKRLQQRAMAF